MPDEQNTSHTSPFDAIRKVDEQGREYWSARDLGKLLGYKTNYRNFQTSINKAKIACETSGQAISDHFAQVRKQIKGGKGAVQTVDDYELSRYACYLIVQNADAEKPIVALGQTYFAVQTRRQELADQLASLPEDQKRLVYRSQMTILDQQLSEAAKKAGATHSLDFATFFNHGYRGLYGGETEDAIHARKALKPKEKILDYMGSDELIYNAFRATLTKHRLDREQPTQKEEANKTHYEVGSDVRETIKRQGGPLPEELPTPEKSIQQVQKDEEKRIEQRQQPALFDEFNEPEPGEE